MRILVDICHPAHAHFFRNPIRILKSSGHEVCVTSRDKECALELLQELRIDHTPLSTQGSGISSLGGELVRRNWALYKTVRRLQPEVMAAIGGTFVAQVGWLTGIPSLVFYDTENAMLQNAITYPFASSVIVPECYQAWVPRRRCIRYRGYHELSYLHPDRFTPDRRIAIENGLDPEKPTFLLRLVSWKANHDIGERGWNGRLLRRLVDHLSPLGKVLISAEGQLPAEMERLRYRGNAADLHHLMAFCRAHIGESATTASECAVLGVPAIYVAQTGRGYTDEQESRYGLVKNVKQTRWEAVEHALEVCLSKPLEYWAQARAQMLRETVDVASFAVECIENDNRAAVSARLDRVN